MATEAHIQKAIIKYIESIDGYVVNGIYSKAGIPDLIGMVNGRFIAIEVKKPETKNNVSKLQQYNLDKINKLGGIAFMAYSVEMVKEKLECIV